MVAWLRNIVGRLVSDQNGNVAIIFGLSALALVTATGAGLDLSRVFVSRQELSHAATLTCQYSTRPTVASQAYNGNATAYTAQVNAFAATAVQNQEFQQTQANNAAFTYVSGGTSSVTMSASVPTVFMAIIGVNSVPISVTIPCSTAQTQSNTTSSTIINESFENSACSGTCVNYYNQAGGQGPPTTAQLFNGKVAYIGVSGNQWSVSGYCLEVDAVGVIRSTVADGSHSAELDCDNGSGSSGNSAISTKTYLAAGSYELRYSFASRVAYSNYDPAYICGSTAADNAWANDTNSVGSPVAHALRTNQINVYLDQDQSGAPPTHVTIDGTETLAGSNLIDMCVQSYNWIQRSVKITISAAGNYWLTFAADGQNDSFGGQIDAITLCQNSCSGTVQDNFPSQWKSAPALFEDNFESPIQTSDCGSCGFESQANLNLSYGTTNSTSSGWPAQTPNGWVTAPYNAINYILKSSYQGTQSIQLDVYNTNVPAMKNATIARSFTLDPGYYQVTYDYVSNIIFSSAPGQSCKAAPGSGSLSAYVYSANLAGTNRLSGATGSFANDTNDIALFMSNSQMASYPNAGGSQNSATTYTNPDGSVSATPSVAPDSLNVASYNSSQVNPLLDICGYSASWLPRTTYVKITKPGQYWLTFAAKGTADNVGGVIDDVKLTALNSLYGSAPSFPVAIPTASAAPGSTISYTGFSIVADPLQP